jgi:peptidoglycan-N-acetylglucosamine deacetylase
MRSLNKLLVFVAFLFLFVLSGIFVFFSFKDAVFHSSRSSNRVALTFDDGPDGYNTLEALKILRKYNITATFFVVGRNIQGNEGLLNEIVRSGHELGIHSYSHRPLFLFGSDEILFELNKTAMIVENVTGREAKLFRPPYGIMSVGVNALAKDLGLRVVMWDVFPRDYSKNAGQISQFVIGKAGNGSIIVLHDTAGAKRNESLSALDEFVPTLLDEGYVFVTVSELLS